MIEMIISKGSTCNYCGEYKKGYIWKRDGEEKYISVCRSCAKQIKKHQKAKQRQFRYDWVNADSQKQANELKQAYTDYQSKAYEILNNENEPEWERVPKDDRIIDSLTDEELACIAAYETVVNRTEMADRSERAKQTYIRNRLNDGRVNKSLLENGSVDTRHYGYIYLSEILKWDIWSKEERDMLECIDMGYEHFRKERIEEYERFKRENEQKMEAVTNEE